MLEQWPKPTSFKFNKSLIKPTEKEIQRIENFFVKKYSSKYALLMPSGRAAINLILNYFKFNRSNVVSVPKWTSGCLYSSIGSITNISVDNLDKSNCIIIVHKWGSTFKLNIKKKKIIKIEDSADCLPNGLYKPFENNSNFEILSLSKIIGSYYGGIILTKDKLFYNHCKKFQTNNTLLSTAKLKKKYKESLKNNNTLSGYDETIYDSFDGNLTANIIKNLKNFKLNINIIKNRQAYIKKIFPSFSFDKKRLGPVILFPQKKFVALKKILELKHFNFRKNLRSNNYEKCFILPIHFGITNQIFYKKIGEIKKIYNL